MKEAVNHYVLLSIKPKYAKMIWEGKKTVEFRRNLPYSAKMWDSALIYESRPVRMITGYVDVIVNWGSPNIIWGAFGERGGIDRAEYDRYVEGCKSVFVLEIYNPPRRFENPIPLSWCSVGRAPQSWRYIQPNLFDILKHTRWRNDDKL